MTYSREQLFITVSVTASSLAVWLYIVTQIQPDKTDTLIMSAFFLSFMMWLGSILAFILFRYKVAKSNKEVIYAFIGPSIRQGFLISATIATLLFLQMLRVVSLWDAVLVAFVGIMIEIAFRHAPQPTTLKTKKTT